MPYDEKPNFANNMQQQNNIQLANNLQNIANQQQFNFTHADQDPHIQHFVQELRNRLPNGIDVEIRNGGMLSNGEAIQLPSIHLSFHNDSRYNAVISLEGNYHTNPGNIDILGMQANNWQNVLNIIRNGFQASINFLQQNHVELNQNIVHTVNAINNNQNNNIGNNNNVGQQNLYHANGQANNIGLN